MVHTRSQIHYKRARTTGEEGLEGREEMDREFAPSLLLLVAALVSTACGLSANPEFGAASGSPAGDVWYLTSDQAGEHVGEDVTVGGLVLDYLYVTGKPGKPTLLLYDVAATTQEINSILRAPESFAVLIWRDDKKNFPQDFGKLYTGKTVCAKGTITIFDEKPVIVAKDESQISVGCQRP
jgi:hypothetical protein